MLLALRALVASAFAFRASVAETETEQSQQAVAFVSISAEAAGLVSAKALNGITIKPRRRLHETRAGLVFMVTTAKDLNERHATYENDPAL
jgi:hypothetical protein